MPDHQYIAKLDANQYIEGTYAIQNNQLGQTKNGKPFLKALICDKTGRTPARMWNISKQMFDELPTNGFVFIRGQTQPYQGEIQVIVQDIGAIEPSEADLERLLPTTEYDVNEMYDEVQQIVGSFENEQIRKLAQLYLNDDAMMAKFRQAPAAMTLHHAYIGGLLEHTLGLLRVAKAILPLYPKLNSDIVLMGLFLHDLGKCVELTWREGFGYSDDGQLVGHIARGVTWLHDKINQFEADGEKFNIHIRRVLEHIILSHHGVPEFGALKIPSTPEAIFINLVDNIDAKMQMSLSAARGDEEGPANELGGNFTEKIWALDTRLFRPDPTTLTDE